MTSIGEDTEKQDPSYNASGNAKYYSHCGKWFENSSKVNTELSWDPAISLLSKYPEELKT